MKIIFEDIDGVFNAFYTKTLLYGFCFIDDDKIELLKQLIDHTGAKVVLTSTWRQGWHDMNEGLDNIDVKLFVGLRDKLLEFGIELLDYTPITNGGMNRRGEEIDMWLKAWEGEPIESYVILDDLNGCYLRPHSSRLVRTSMAKGLLQKHVDMAVNILNKPVITDEKEEPASHAELVDYQWSQDGVIERCELMEDTLKEETVCYHCDRKMEAGEKVVFLFPMDGSDEYTICPECAKKACTQA